MRRWVALLTLVAALGVGGCRQRATSVWFKGDLDAAVAAARQRNTLVMVEFFTDWCNWCRRLDTDTFRRAEVRRELEELVAVRFDAEKDGAPLAARFEVDSFPTLVFLDPDGNEVDRILGYLPPDKFLHRVQKIRTGDTFLACLRRLREDPGNQEAIRRSVEGLLERSDPMGAISKLEDFAAASGNIDPELCRHLMFAAQVDLHSRVYQRAAKLYLKGRTHSLEVPDTAGTRRLHALVAEGLPELPEIEQAELLRQARYEDAGSLLALIEAGSVSEGDLLEVAGFAFSNGHFDLAADLYLRWYQAHGDEAEASVLNDIAWRLYLGGTELEAATEIARRSLAMKETPESGDTLARLLYVTGSIDQAVDLEVRAAQRAGGARGDTYLDVARRMEAGEKLEDSPSFSTYPGPHPGAL